MHLVFTQLTVSEQPPVVWPIVVYFAATVLLVGFILLISYLLGQRHEEPATGEPYEGGVVPQGTTGIRISPTFYMIAMFFVVFDLEAVFIYAWAVAGREAGWWGYRELVIFVVVLAATLAYLWRIGALDWAERGTGRRRIAGG